MCGRVRLANDYSEIKIRLKFAPDAPVPNYEVDYNKPPTMPMLVAIRSVDGQRIPKVMKWGLIPYWAKDEQARLLDLQRQIGGVHHQACVQGRMAARAALPGRHQRVLRMEETRSEGQAQASLRGRCGGRRRNGDGWSMVDVARSHQR